MGNDLIDFARITSLYLPWCNRCGCPVEAIAQVTTYDMEGERALTSGFDKLSVRCHGEKMVYIRRFRGEEREPWRVTNPAAMLPTAGNA